MPFTPLHMGPALAVKAVMRRRFSVLAFGLAQVAIDIEPAIGLWRGWERLHGWTHTYLGATAIASLVTVFCAPICLWILRRWNAELRNRGLAWLVESDELAPGSVAAGAFIGTLSHVALDSLMHPDMRPLAPFSPYNTLLDAVPLAGLEIGCIVAGAAGMAAWVLVTRARVGPGPGKEER
jgi:hypothetical protein